MNRVRSLDGNGYRGVSSYSYEKLRFAVGFTVVSYRMPPFDTGKNIERAGSARASVGTRSSLNSKLVSGIASSRTRVHPAVTLELSSVRARKVKVCRSFHSSRSRASSRLG